MACHGTGGGRFDHALRPQLMDRARACASSPDGHRLRPRRRRRGDVARIAVCNTPDAPTVSTAGMGDPHAHGRQRVKRAEPAPPGSGDYYASQAAMGSRESSGWSAADARAAWRPSRRDGDDGHGPRPIPARRRLPAWRESDRHPAASRSDVASGARAVERGAPSLRGRAVRWMKRGAAFNTARGGLVDGDACSRARRRTCSGLAWTSRARRCHHHPLLGRDDVRSRLMSLRPRAMARCASSAPPSSRSSWPAGRRPLAWSIPRSGLPRRRKGRRR